jgi:hypothetical protein
MAKRQPQEWQEVEFADMLGMSTNTVDPGTKLARRMLNVHSHEKPGAITLRTGYTLKYPAPINENISESTFPNFDMFFDRQASLGQEVTVLIQKGILHALKDSGGNPIVDDIFMGFWFWNRPFWNLNQWTDGWRCINHTIITKLVAAPDDTYKSLIRVFGNESHGLIDDSLIRYTIYNKTKEQFARILTCKAEGDNLRINHTLFDNSWEADDVVIISKYWIDEDLQTTYYNLVQPNEIVFHNILDDLRIGFGGQPGRIALAIGYRRKYIQINELDFPNIHDDLAAANMLEHFSTINDVVLDTITLNSEYGMLLTKIGGTLDAPSTHYFRLTGLMDGYAEMLISETSIDLDEAAGISIELYSKTGIENPRLTSFRLYHSIDKITYFKVNDRAYSSDAYTNPFWKITSDGRMITVEKELEMYSEDSCISKDNNIDSLGSCFSCNPVTQTTLVSSGVGTFVAKATKVIAYVHGSNFIDLIINADNFSGRKLEEGVEYKLSLKITSTKQSLAKFQLGYGTPPVAGVYDGKFSIQMEGNDFYLTNDGTMIGIWIFTVPKDFINNKPVGTVIAIRFVANVFAVADHVEFSELSLQPTTVDSKELIFDTGVDESKEMSAVMGYVPTKDLIKSWDHTLELKGRIYYLNPYVDKRYENIILVSFISPPNTFMWDIASFGNYRELKRAGHAIGMVLLPNQDILILKDNSLEPISDDGLAGVPRESIYGVGCKSRDTIVNNRGTILWADEDDLYMINLNSGFSAIPILEETIKDLYSAIIDKNKLFATRDRYNTYRLRVNDPQNKTEFLINKNGIIEESKQHFPEIYRINSTRHLTFLSDGLIFEAEGELEPITPQEIIIDNGAIL